MRQTVEADSLRTFRKIAELFPVACSTDEYYFFPHLRNRDCDLGTWDQFSAETVREAAEVLSAFENRLGNYSKANPDRDTATDIRLLQQFSLSLREQLTENPVWKTQPSFYLTLICKGIEEALLDPDRGAVRERIQKLPGFIERAIRNLDTMPLAYRDIGVDMISSVRVFIQQLSGEYPEILQSLTALEKLHEKLLRIPVTDNIYSYPEILERQVRVHFGIHLDFQEIEEILEREIHEMKKVMEVEAGKISGGKSWQEVYQKLALPAELKKDKVALFQNEINKLREHCISAGLFPAGLAAREHLKVHLMPENISAIRAASSYSIGVGEVTPSGTFFIYHDPSARIQETLREYRMLAAHETYPGHHLLDSARMILARPSRRAVEMPFFYEGWACFAEELMMLSGYLTRIEDRLLLSIRRFRRAIRGKVDLAMQTGKMLPPEAAMYMKKTGLPGVEFLPSVLKYTLNPGYQLCYTLGIRRMLEFYIKHGNGSPAGFTAKVLLQGEIPMEELEKFLKHSRS